MQLDNPYDFLPRKSFIKGYNVGANISILKTTYIRPQKLPNGNYGNDWMLIIYKDLDTGEKKLEAIEKPWYRYFMINDGAEEDLSYNRICIESSKVHYIDCRYNDLKLSIAKETNNLEFFRNNIKSGNYKENDRLFDIPTIFQADMNIENFYRFEFDRLYKNTPFEPSKLYFDIETNNIEIGGEFPKPGECSVNAVSVVDDANKKIYVLLLEDPNNRQINEFRNNPKIAKELKEFVGQHVGGLERETEFGLQDFEYKIVFFKEEIDLIASIFRIINASRPDYVLAWNMAFDLPYLIARIFKLGYNPADIICDPSMPIKFCEYYIDQQSVKFEEKSDHAVITSYSEYLDQLIHFASRRKGQRAIGSFRLDHIGEIVAKVRKVNYSAITNKISELPLLNYKLFVFYNVCDTIVQKCIEHETEDMNYILSKAITNNTKTDKVHRQTVYLYNRAVKDYYYMGYIMGDNINRKNNKKDSFTGALVSEPSKLSDKPKIILNGRPINVLKNLVDFDYSSLYPSCLIQNNMAANTMLGKILLPEQISVDENKFASDGFDRSTFFIEDYLSGNWIDFCHRWFKLPDYEEMFNLIYTYFSTVTNASRGLRYYNPLTGNKYMTYPIANNKKNRLMYVLKSRLENQVSLRCVKMPKKEA